MTFSYDKPLMLSNQPQAIAVTAVKHGVTQVSLSDGRIVRLTIHVDGVTAASPEAINVSYSVVTEVMPAPDSLIMDVHEGLQ